MSTHRRVGHRSSSIEGERRGDVWQEILPSWRRESVLDALIDAEEKDSEKVLDPLYTRAILRA